MNRDFNQERNAHRQGRWSHLHRTLGISALAAIGCFSVAANATVKTDFGIDYQATGFYVQSESFDNPDGGKSHDNDTGFAQFMRLKADFKHEETGIEVHTRIELAGDRWSGDNRAYQTTADNAFNPSNRGDNVRLDLGFVQIPLGTTLLRVGRQEANWSNCFLVCDDRRDRILALHKFGNISAFMGYDRRQDTTAFNNQDNGDQFFPGFVAPLGNTGWNFAFLYVHWLNNFDGSVTGGDGTTPYVLSDVNLFSPYLSGKAGPVSVDTGFTYVGSGNVDNPTPENGDYFTDDAWSEYFRIGADLGMFEAKAQYVGTQDGGLVSPGFDTYSSLINSNPESTANPTSVYRMGGFLGRHEYNENLYIGSLTANVTPKMAIRGAVGVLGIDVPKTSVAGNNHKDSSMVYDLQASYQINSALRTWATLGMLEKNDVGTLSGNSLIGGIPNGGSFADDRIVAGSVNLGVEF